MKDTCEKLKQPFLRGLPEGDHVTSRYESIDQLRQWLDTQPHLPSLTDDHLVLFLHGCQDNLKSTKQTIESYCTIKTLTPEFFSNRDVLGQDIQDIADICELVMLPSLTFEGYKVMMFRLTDYTPSKLSLLPTLKAFCMSIDYHISENGLMDGVTAIFDMKGFSILHLFRVRPLNLVKKVLYYIQDCLPITLKSIHIINAIYLAGKLLALIKPFIKKELADMLHVHTCVDGVRDFVALEDLPEEYGGNCKSITSLYNEQRQQFESEYREWFRQGEEIRSDESKRAK